jgi:hypothetical protein
LFIFSSVILLLSYELGARVQQLPPGSVEGIVVRSGGREPVADAQVRLIRTTVALSETSRSIALLPGPATVTYTATTNSSGRFSFTNLEAGTYHLFVVARGYAAQEYGQRTFLGPGSPITLNAGQAGREITISLMPTGAIAGRIFSETGQPAVNALVQVYRPSFNPQGKTYQVAGATSADDRGEYRLYGIAPGRYYLSVGKQVETENPATSSNSARDYAFQLYPGVSELDQAVSIEVRPGSEITIDMKPRPRQGYAVRGSVIDPETGRPPGKVNLTLILRTLVGPRSIPVRKYDPATGIFEAQEVTAGSYTLQAQTQVLNDPSVAAAGEAAWAVFPTARVPITVVDRDLEDVVLTLKRPIAVSGRVRVEGQPTATQARVHLRPIGDRGRMTPVVDVQPDGTFRIFGLIEGDYFVEFQHYAPGLYVKSIRFDGTDILTQPFRVSGSENGTIEIILHSGVARLEGIVMDARSQPVSSSSVLLLPEQRSRTDLYTFVQTDQNGRFQFSRLSPGGYKIFAWETVDTYSFYDPDFIRQFEQLGKRIDVAESSNGTVDIRVIPLP